MTSLVAYARHEYRLIAAALALAALSQAILLVDPIIFRYVIDRYAAHPADFTTREFLHGVGLLLIVGMGTILLARLGGSVQGYCLAVLGQRLGTRLYADGVAHVLRLPYAAFETCRSGEIVGILQRARSDSHRLVTLTITLIFGSFAGFLFAMVYALTVHWLLVPVYLCAVPLVAVLSLSLSRCMMPTASAVVTQTAALAGATVESLRHVELIKSLGLVEQEIGRLNGTTDRILALELSNAQTVRTTMFVQTVALNLVRSGLLFMLLFLTYRGVMSLGEVLSLLICSSMFFGPFQEMGGYVSAFRETEASLRRYDELRHKPVEAQTGSARPIDRIDSITFERVTLRHASTEIAAVADVSLHIEHGDTIAFVGASGAGKTMLIKLLTRLYEPTGGRLLYNGIPSCDVTLDSVRGQIGLVTQEAPLFHGTVRENLRFATATASDDGIREALRKAACDHLLDRPGGGLDAVIGEGGLTLSAGERQRLAIARALLRRPSLLLFDEATSALDSRNEQEIVATIEALSAGRNLITVLVAHRLSTVKHAARIYVVDRGRIVDRGTHDELVRRRGPYQAMWYRQVDGGPPRQAAVAAPDGLEAAVGPATASPLYSPHRDQPGVSTPRME